MAGQIKVNTDQVNSIANNIDNLNNRLLDELKQCQSTIKSLASTWDGEASNETINSFDNFANKYFQNYHDIIDQYVRFLREGVAQGYFETETANKSLADAFK